MPSIRIVLPARLQSSRLAEKLLQQVGGKSVLRHTYEAASRARCCQQPPLVAVDDPRLAAEVDAFGGQWILTPKDCPSGTDRIAAAARQMPGIDLFVNVQSDEPEIDPRAIDAVAALLAEDPSADLATAATPIRSPAALGDPSVVKVVLAEVSGTGADSRSDAVTTGQGRAVYFSRAAIPHDRDGRPEERLRTDPPIFWHHLGLYAYRRAFLEWFAATPPSPLENVERLEQLRAVEAGKKIVVAAVPPSPPGIDTAEDLEAFRRRAATRN